MGERTEKALWTMLIVVWATTGAFLLFSLWQAWNDAPKVRAGAPMEDAGDGVGP